MNEITLTEKEKKMTRYCEDFCPIYEPIRQFNCTHNHRIFCNTEFCAHIINVYILNVRGE